MTIYLLQYNWWSENHYGGDWDHYFEEEHGFYTDKAKAEAKASSLNERDHRAKYNNYEQAERAKHEHAKKESETLFKRNEALRAAGLDPIPGNESARFATFTPLPFEEWTKARYNLDHYYDIREFEAAADE